MAKYFEDNLQYIFKTIQEAKILIALILLEKPYNKALKAIFLNVYYDKTYMEYYNFCQ